MGARSKAKAHQDKQLARADAKVRQAEEDAKKKDPQTAKKRERKELLAVPSSPKATPRLAPVLSPDSESENKRHTAALWSLFDSFVSNRDESIESGVIRQLGKAHESLGAEAGWDSRRNSSLMCKLRATEQVEVDGCVSGTDRQANRQTDRLAG